METKSVLKVFGTLLLLLSLFGYLFPDWGKVDFTNNENLAHLLLALLAFFMATFSNSIRAKAIFGFSLLFLLWGLYGFMLPKPTDFHLGVITMQLDEFDNYLHLVMGLALSWFWLPLVKLPNARSATA
jgi:hypothetical protein